MRNDYVVNEAIGQSGVRSITIKVWDAREKFLRDCLIDAADLALVSEVNGLWVAHRARGKAQKWYVQTKTWTEFGARTVMMHRLILGLTDPEIEADHRDNDGLNNQRYNLRRCTHLENIRFRQPEKDWVEYDRRNEFAAEYRIERGIARGVAEMFGLTRAALFAIRTGRTVGSPAAVEYRAACAGKCRIYRDLKASSPVEGRKWGAVLV